MKKETTNIQPDQMWAAMSRPQQEASVYFAVSDWRTGVGRDYVDAMGIEGQILDSLVKQGIVESKPTWKMFQDEADKLNAEVQEIRGKMKDHFYQLQDTEREVLQAYNNFTTVAGYKSEKPRFRLADQRFHNYIRTSQG